MITVPEATEKIIKRSRYLTEAISKGIINYSSLARYIKKEVEEITFKKVSHGSIVMALNRISKEIPIPKKKKLESFTLPDISVKSGIFEIVVTNTQTSHSIRDEISNLQNQGLLITVLSGKNQMSILSTEQEMKKLSGILRNEEILYERHKLSTITVRLSQETLETPGVFYSVLKSFAWEDINVIDIFSTYLDFTIVIDEKDIEKAFSVIRSIFISEKGIF